MSRQSLIATFQLIRSDMQFRSKYEHKTLNCLRVLSFLTNHAVMAQVLYRWQIFFSSHHLGVIASLIKGVNSLILSVNIDASARIGPGLLLLHANHIYIGKNVTIGKNCILAQQNAICPAYLLTAQQDSSHIGPTIGDNTLLGVGSTVIGHITIGNNVKISVNTAVDKSFPDHATLIGVPAKNLTLS